MTEEELRIPLSEACPCDMARLKPSGHLVTDTDYQIGRASGRERGLSLGEIQVRGCTWTR